jgi:hypothetical protein
MEKSGDMSVREVEEFSVHPNSFKRELGVGQAMMLIPHEGGMKTIKIKFDRYPDVEAQEITNVTKTVLPLLEVPKAETSKAEDATPSKKSKRAKSINAAKIKNAA